MFGTVYIDDNGDVQMDVPPNSYVVESVPMKVKTSFYARKTGVEFDPVIHVKYPKSRADQLSATSTAKLVDAMFRTGQMVQAAKSLYDFPDGKDDGRDVPVDRMRGVELPEVSQLMQDNEAKIRQHEQNLKAMTSKKKDVKEPSGGADGSKSESSVADVANGTASTKDGSGKS